jgi:hypothetical protein
MGGYLISATQIHIEAILLLGLSSLVLIVLFILRGRKGPRPSMRQVPAFQDLRDETGRAAESGGALHIALGSGELYGEYAMTSLASLQVVESLADEAVSYSAPPVITVGALTLLPLAQDILRRAYERSGRPEAYDPGKVRFVAPSPVAYAAGAANTISSENITASMTVGSFGPEASLITDAGSRHDLPQLAGLADPRAISALYPTTDRLAMGEELYTGGAQMTGERRYLVGLVAQDILRIVVALLVVFMAALVLLGAY